MSIPQRIYVYLAAFVAFAILLQGAYGLATDIARAARHGSVPVATRSHLDRNDNCRPPRLARA